MTASPSAGVWWVLMTTPRCTLTTLAARIGHLFNVEDIRRRCCAYKNAARATDRKRMRKSRSKKAKESPHDPPKLATPRPKPELIPLVPADITIEEATSWAVKQLLKHMKQDKYVMRHQDGSYDLTEYGLKHTRTAMAAGRIGRAIAYTLRARGRPL